MEDNSPRIGLPGTPLVLRPEENGLKGPQPFEVEVLDYVIISGFNVDVSVLELGCPSGHYDEKMGKPQSLQNTLS